MKIVLALALAGMLTAPAMADRCRDPKTGRAAKCSQPGTVPFDKPKMAVNPNISAPDKTGRCHVVKAFDNRKPGQFVACPK